MRRNQVLFRGMSDQPPPPKAIHITPQLLLMVLLVMLMLALPLTVTAWFMVMHFRENNTASDGTQTVTEVDDSALRASFESVADGAWAGLSAPLDDAATGRATLRVIASDSIKKQQDLLEQVQGLGGTSVVFPADASGDYRMLVTLSEPNARIFLKSQDEDPLTIPVGQGDVLVEVYITSEASE